MGDSGDSMLAHDSMPAAARIGVAPRGKNTASTSRYVTRSSLLSVFFALVLLPSMATAFVLSRPPLRSNPSTQGYKILQGMCMDSSPPKQEIKHRQLISRRNVFGVAAGSALVFSSSPVSADAPAKDKAAAVAKQMAVVMFTKKIEEATDKAIALEKKGKFEEAEQQWNIVIDTYRKGGDGVVLSPQALYRLSKSLVFRGDVRAELGQQKKVEAPLLGAVEDYTKAIELGSSPETQIKLGTVFVALGRYEEAEAKFGKVIESGVGNEVRARAYNNRAIARGRMNKWPEAVSDYNEAVQETKGTTEALSNLALAKFQTGDAAASLTMLQNLMKEMPYGVIAGGEDVPAAIAAVQFAAGDKDAARASLAKVDDVRFKDVRYVKEARFWPPKLVEALGSLLAAK